ncbi:cilia- and flagella-associated protein 299 isoform X2 [Alosa sapidissima]|uniref:cilia- and flagella-associated protein 299 isoform X2 n=1 Tax=Alosa sapidissima TaxID=34773 RepID=UPI001C091D0B|nr:cilia- and flagella-associated protein 299 isoform X2 [Alosa sapidissima]
MEEDNAAAALDSIVTEFHSYEDFLDSQITSLDLYYLEDEELARHLVELGYRGSGEVLKREEFETRKAAAEASRLNKRSQRHCRACWTITRCGVRLQNLISSERGPGSLWDLENCGSDSPRRVWHSSEH